MCPSKKILMFEEATPNDGHALWNSDYEWIASRHGPRRKLAAYERHVVTSEYIRGGCMLFFDAHVQPKHHNDVWCNYRICNPFWRGNL